jgi:isocitrate dehydrogenase
MTKIKKIKVNKKSKLVILHGDEMAQVAFDKILDQFIKKYLDIALEEIDLSAVNRIRTNGKIVTESIDKLNKYGVGLKNAGITVNKDQLNDIVEQLKKDERLKIHKDKLDRLATKSPNGAIRKGVHGNITREDIPFTNLRDITPDWKGKKIDVVTMDNGGLKGSYNEVSEHTGILKLSFVSSKGKHTVLHTRKIGKGDPWLVATHSIKDVIEWSQDFFSRAVREKRDVYIGLKDTVMPGYDGVIKEAVEQVFYDEYADEFEKHNLKYEYGLIDAQAAKLIVNPPDGALWGIPDNTSGRKIYKLVEALKERGMPDRPHQKSISRMSAGGGDQYGSFNAPAEDDGILVVQIDEEERHARDVKKGDPIIIMSNEHVAIEKWMQQVFDDAVVKKQEIYFGLKAQYMAYDMLFSDIISRIYRHKILSTHDYLPSYMVMRPSEQLIKMLLDPPLNARYPALNMDGDIFSDITAALGGSLATASSIIEGTEGVMLFEAPHGTAPDLYEKYIESKGKICIFNPSALIYAVANTLQVIANKDGNAELLKFSDKMKTALIKTVEDGFITGDIKGRTTEPKKEKVVDLPKFLDEVEKRLT